MKVYNGSADESHQVEVVALRDYFAAAAITGMMANDAILNRMVEAEDVAHHAFGIADAMLKERNT